MSVASGASGNGSSSRSTTLLRNSERMPKHNEFLDRTDWDQADVTDAFESWNSALEAAGISVEDALIAELERVAESVDGDPTSGDMNRQGAYSAAKYSTHFGSWAAAVDAATLDSDDSSVKSGATPEEPQTDAPADEGMANHESVLDDYFTLVELLTRAGSMAKQPSTSLNATSRTRKGRSTDRPGRHRDDGDVRRLGETRLRVRLDRRRMVRPVGSASPQVGPRWGDDAQSLEFTGHGRHPAFGGRTCDRRERGSDAEMTNIPKSATATWSHKMGSRNRRTRTTKRKQTKGRRRIRRG